MGTHLKRLCKVLLMTTNNICFGVDLTKRLCGLLSGAMISSKNYQRTTIVSVKQLSTVGDALTRSCTYFSQTRRKHEPCFKLFFGNYTDMALLYLNVQVGKGA